ncbi:MAG TPA: hypothetical protein VFX16_30310 [Pseudonocardiaceae bacterium]|nr:hypothetical protein [Pseudonocardiaceae bacterium]
MLSTLLYPWDVAANGVRATIGELAELGVDSMLLSATYHPIAATSMRPTGPRPFHSAAGEVLFDIDPTCFAESGVTPLVRQRHDFWSTIGDTARAAGLGFDAWVVTVFQPWLARGYPDTARTYPSGDLNLDAVCPLAPRYQVYLRELVGDIVTRSRPDRVLLENLLFTPYDYGWIRPRTLVDVSAIAARLLGLCFCAGCRAAGTAAGLDIDAFRQEVCRRIDAEFGLASPPAAGFDQDLQRYLDSRSIRLGAYVEELARLTRLVLWAAEGYGMTALAPALARAADSLLVFDDTNLPVAKPSTRLLYVVSSFGADEQRLTAQAEAATTAGHTEIALYNWGLVPRANFARSVEICTAAQAG